MQENCTLTVFMSSDQQSVKAPVLEMPVLEHRYQPYIASSTGAQSDLLLALVLVEHCLLHQCYKHISSSTVSTVGN